MSCPQSVMGHRWVWLEDEDGARVEECVRCGEERCEPLVDPEPEERDE